MRTQSKSKDILFQTDLLKGNPNQIGRHFFRLSSVTQKGTFTRWPKLWPGILTWTRKYNDSIKRDKQQEVPGVRGRIPKWNHLAAAWDSPNLNSRGLSTQANSGSLHQIQIRPTGESQSLCRNRVAKIWNQIRLRRLGCLSVPNTTSNEWLNLYGRFTQMAGDPRRCGFTP